MFDVPLVTFSSKVQSPVTKQVLNQGMDGSRKAAFELVLEDNYRQTTNFGACCGIGSRRVLENLDWPGSASKCAMLNFWSRAGTVGT